MLCARIVSVTRGALLLALVLVVAGCASSTRVSGPFAANGGIEGGMSSGLWGDTSSGPTGQYLGCINIRRYTQAVTLGNRTNAPVTVTDVQVPNPNPRIIARAGVQFRLAKRSDGRMMVTNMGRWSTAHSTPVTIQPGEAVAVQANYLMGHCGEIGSRPIVVDGEFTVWYLTSGHGGRQELVQPSARIVLSRGPTLNRCSNDLLAADIDCSDARVAADGCRKLTHPNWGDCSAAGRTWSCSYYGRSAERCWLATKHQWFKVRRPA